MYILYLVDWEKPLKNRLISFKSKVSKQLLSDRGLFNIKEKNIFREKISIEDYNQITHYIKNYTLAYNQISKNHEKVFQIPYKYELATRNEYIISPILKFVVTQSNKFENFFLKQMKI